MAIQPQIVVPGTRCETTSLLQRVDLCLKISESREDHVEGGRLPKHHLMHQRVVTFQWCSIFEMTGKIELGETRVMVAPVGLEPT